MSRPCTAMNFYDECKTLSIANLKQWGYLVPQQRKAGIISWCRDGEKYASIKITVDTIERCYLELSYVCDNKPINYRINLVQRPSNIKKGVLWVFICPQTQKGCRKLYMVGDYFLHRQAFKDVMYRGQTLSKLDRLSIKKWNKEIYLDVLYEQLSVKHFKKAYSNLLTKRYKKLIERINKIKNS